MSYPRFYRCVGEGCSRTYRRDAPGEKAVRTGGRKGKQCQEMAKSGYWGNGCNLVPVADSP